MNNTYIGDYYEEMYPRNFTKSRVLHEVDNFEIEKYLNSYLDADSIENNYYRGKYEYTILSFTAPAIPGVSKKITHKIVLEASYPDDIQGDVEKELKKCLKSSLTDGMQILTLSAVAASGGGIVAMMSAVSASITPAVDKVRDSFVSCVRDVASLKNVSNRVNINIVHKKQ